MRAKSPNKTRLGGSTVAMLGLLLLIPGYALSRLSPKIDAWWLIGVPLSVSVFAFFAYRSDKRRAEEGRWRIPEATLHLLSLMGGWPGAFVAQRVFRHKTSKLSFQFVFWSVVALHQFLAVDSLLDWRLTSDAFRFARAQIS